jgi:hypothetical protein
VGLRPHRGVSPLRGFVSCCGLPRACARGFLMASLRDLGLRCSFIGGPITLARWTHRLLYFERHALSTVAFLVNGQSTL